MKTSTPRDAVQLSPNAVTVLEKRYLVKDDGGRPVETPSDLFWRVARTIAGVTSTVSYDASSRTATITPSASAMISFSRSIAACISGVVWEAKAEQRLANIPSFIRPMRSAIGTKSSVWGIR